MYKCKYHIHEWIDHAHLSHLTCRQHSSPQWGCCSRGAHRLLPGCHQLHAVHSALSRVRFSKMRRVLRLYEVFTKSFLSLDIILLTFTCLPYQPLQLSSFALFRLSGLCASSDRLDENHVRLEVAKFLRTELPLESRAFLTPTHGEGQAWQCRQLAEFFGADLHWTTTVTA